MNIDGLKKAVKSNPRLECFYMCMKSIKDKEIAKEMVGTKRSPNNLIVRTFGQENADKFIYYILLDESARFNGFCSLYRLVLMHLAYAESMMLTPVVCFGKNTLYFESSFEGSTNAFEYFFEPVSNIPYETVLCSKRVILAKGADAGAFGTTEAYAVPQEEINFLAPYLKKYIHLKNEIKALFCSDLQNIIAGNATLGVHVRATDFNKGYNRHPHVVSPEEYLEKTSQIFEKNEYKKVFLATDDEFVVHLFKERFGNNLLYFPDTYRSQNGEAIHYGKIQESRKYHKFMLGLEIIKDFYTLGYCAGLIAGNSNVSMCSRIIKKSLGEEYKTLEIIDKGINHNMHETRGKFNSMLKNK